MSDCSQNSSWTEHFRTQLTFFVKHVWTFSSLWLEYLFRVRLFSKHSLKRTFQKLLYCFTSAELFPYLLTIFNFFFLLITAREICQLGTWRLLYLRVVRQTTMDSQRWELSASDYNDVQLFKIIFLLFWLYGWRNKLLPKSSPGKEKTTGTKRRAKLRTSKNFALG